MSATPAAATANPENPALFPVEPRHVATSEPTTHTEFPSDPADATADVSKSSRKTAWNRPSNGTGELGAVMDAAAWPPLSESTRASPKSSSSESLKSLSEFPSASATPAEQPAPIPNPQPAIASSTSAPPTRQRSMRRGGNGPIANGGHVPSAPAAVEIPGRNGGGWDHGGKASGFAPHGHGRIDHHHHRGYGGNHRKGGGGGAYHNGNNSRHDHHDRRGYEWNPCSNFAGKNMPMSPHQRPMQRPFFQGGPFTGPAFIGPPSPVRPYGVPLSFPPEIAGQMMYPLPPPMHHDPLRGPMPFVPQQVMYQLPPDQDLSKSSAILKQIEYYFSNENLCKDIYLRERMNEEGWVPVALIANFNKVKELSTNIYFIVDAVRASSVVEVQGDKIRRRNDWPNWVIRSPSNRAANLQSDVLPDFENLTGRMRTMGLGEGTASQYSIVAPAQAFSGSSSGEFYSQSLTAATPRSGGSTQCQ